MALGLSLALALIGATAARAEAKPAFSVQPAAKSKTGYFVLAATPGATIQSSVEVLNTGNRTGTASIYAVDGTTGQTSGAVYRSRQEPRRDVGAWIQLEKSTVSLAPHTKETIPFAVSVPAGAFAGQHLGGIVVQPASPAGRKTVGKANHASFQVKIRELSVVAVEVNLPGTRAVKTEVTGIRAGGIPGRQSLLIGLSNLGNVFVKCDGSLTVANQDGQRVKHRDFALDTLVSHTHINYPLYTSGKSLPNGTYKGTVALTCRGHHLVRSFPFKITSGTQEQVFGAPGHPLGANSSNHTLLYVLLGAGVLLLAAIAFGLYRYLWREGYI